MRPYKISSHEEEMKMFCRNSDKDHLSVWRRKKKVYRPNDILSSGSTGLMTEYNSEVLKMSPPLLTALLAGQGSATELYPVGVGVLRE